MNLEILSVPFFQRAIIACLLAGIICGTVGTFVVARRISSISGSLSHAALGGVGFAHFFGWSSLVGAAIFSVITAIGIALLHFRAKGDLDTLITMVWSLGMALGVILMSLTPGYAVSLESFLFGSVLFVSRDYLYLAGAVALLLIIFTWLHFHTLRAICFDEDYSLVSGYPCKTLFVALLTVTALAIVVLIKVVGVILMISLLTTPALIGRHWSNNLSRIMLIASLLAVFCCLGGLFFAYFLSTFFDWPLPTGPIIVVVTTLAYLLSLIMRPKQLN